MSHSSLIPILTFLGAIFFGYTAYKESKNNKTPVWKIGDFWFFVTLMVSTTIILITNASNHVK